MSILTKLAALIFLIVNYCVSAYYGMLRRILIIAHAHDFALCKVFKRLKALLLLPDGGKVIYPWIGSGTLRFIVREIFHVGVYDLDVQIKDGFIVDVGAHIGVYGLKTARKHPRCLVICVEPDPNNFKLLTRNIKNNNMRNIVAFPVALSDFEGRSKLYLSAKETGDHSMTIRVGNEYSVVQVTTLESLARKIGIKNIKIVKVDAEGSELQIKKPRVRRINVSSGSKPFMESWLIALKSALKRIEIRLEEITGSLLGSDIGVCGLRV